MRSLLAKKRLEVLSVCSLGLLLLTLPMGCSDRKPGEQATRTVMPDPTPASDAIASAGGGTVRDRRASP